MLPPYERSGSSEWYPECECDYQNWIIWSSLIGLCLILSGDHIYKMDYEVMLDYHKAIMRCNDCGNACTMEEASRFGMLSQRGWKNSGVQENAAEPKSNLASWEFTFFMESVEGSA